MEVLAVIPARGGSKGIPGKNMALLCGRPLLDYTIEAARDSKVIDRFAVSSDDSLILEHSDALGAETIARPADLAEDDTPTEPVVRHALEELRRAERYTPDWVVILQPTSPLRTGADIDDAFRAMLESRATGVIGVVELSKTTFKALTVDRQGRLAGLVDDRAPFLPRQSLPPVYAANGAIYIFEVKGFLETGRIPLRDSVPFVMPEARGLDIDSQRDLERAEELLSADHERV